MKFIQYVNTPAGILKINANNNYVVSVKFVKRKEKENPNPISKNVAKQIKEYFMGKRKEFSAKINFEGTDFQNKIWKQLLKTKYGNTITYKELGERAGFPNSARAVGTAMKNNNVCILIPCHRVVGIKNKYSYSAGESKKKFLLNLESN